MSDIDRYSDIYLNFQDRQQWLADTFADMTFEDYMAFVDYCFEQLDFAAERKDGEEFRRVKGLMFAFARKHLETAHFMDGLTDDQRAWSRRAAITYYELAKSFYSAGDVSSVETAWATSLDCADRFGWPSVVFDLLAPHHIFKDECIV